MSTSVDGHLDFSVEVGGRQMGGTLHGSGQSLTLHVDDPRLLGGTGEQPARALAARLAARGLQLSIVADRPLVTLGVPRARLWDRRLTGSPHISVASFPAALRLLRLRRAGQRHGRTRTPLVPPGTPLPIAPTFLRRPRRPTTTHDPAHGGYPRLVLASGPGRASDDLRRVVFPLGDRATVGSDPGCDIVLPGLAPQQAELVRTDDDELVLRPVRPGADVRVHGAVVLHQALLRTGTRIDLGGWTLVYAREEYADHGRPYGGRIGGELGRQQPQPPREVLAKRRR